MEELLRLLVKLLDVHPGFATLFMMALVTTMVAQLKIMIDVNWMRKHSVSIEAFGMEIAKFKIEISEKYISLEDYKMMTGRPKPHGGHSRLT